MVGAFALGRLRRRGAWTLRRLDEPYDLGVLAGARARRIAALVIALLLVEGFAFPRHNTADHLAVVGLAFLVGWRPPARRDLGRMLAETAVASLVFLIICYGYTVFKALTFVGRAPGDGGITALERSLLGFDLYRAIAAWSARRPSVIALCDWVYFKFFLHMALTTALLLGLGRPRERLEYLGALAICYVLGGPLYHLYPAAGPTYADPAAYAHLRGLPHMTNVACMPSLHLAHETVMLW